MKKVLFFLIVLCSSSGVQSQVRITEVMSNGGPTDWFELTNFGSTTVDITGWKMDDNSFAFANSVLLNGITSIAAGERVIFGESGSATYASTFRTLWGISNTVQVGSYTGSGVGLASGGDGVIVFTSTGTEVHRVSFLTSTAGTSFYWGYNADGTFNTSYVGASNVGLASVVGTIGTQITFLISTNTGSPGTSITPVNPVLGCMDATACNYNSTATTSDNSCTYGQTYYLDQDGDGYGVSTTSIVSCTATAGYVLSSTDCNDNVAAISPGASENCLNLLDDNCDGLVNVGCPQAEVSIASASNFIQVNENAGTVTIPVTVTNANALPINVQFSLSVYSNATAGLDYTWTNTMVINPLTNGVINHSLTIIDDAIIENAERIIVKISSTDNGIVNATNNYRIIFISDNEANPISSSNELNLNLLSSFSNGATGINSAEIVAHDAQSQRLFIANSIAGKMDIVNFSNPAAPVLISSISMSPYGNINSIAVHNGIVAAAIENINPQANGKIVFFDTDGVFLNEVPAGAMPDMITFSKDYTKVITANEGEPNGTYSLDPEGSITVVDISGGVANLTSANATQIMLTQFNGQEVALRAQGIRIFSTSATVAQDLEPENVAVSDDNAKAYVTLQENNAMLVLNLLTNTIESILPLGYADYSAGSGNSLDASDQSGAILNTSDLPIKGAYMPDAISYSTINGSGYVFMANEGDSREFGSVIDANRISSSVFNNLDAAAFPDAAILKNNKFLGRLSALKYSGDTDGDGDYDELHVMGSRSFTIRNAATNALVFDSKDMFEKITANSPLTSAFFNASNTTGAAASKNRSDDKGPEPEGVTVSVINGIHYAFIALERVGGCMVFNVENPSAPVFVTYVNNRTLNGSGPDLGAEGIIFISGPDSPNGQPIVILANEVSSTLSIFGIGCPNSNWYADTDGDGFGSGTVSNTCTQPVGYVSNNIDCNNAVASINPVASEVCNGIDDNCNLLADDGLTFTNYYADTDADGYGAGAATNACAQPTGFVVNNTDCNNALATVNPAAIENCGNSIDDNCNATIDEGCTTAGENPNTAISMSSSIWPNCNAVNGTLVNAIASASAQTICLTGEDKWHQFVATSEGLSIVVNSTSADILIELQTAAGTLVAQENAVSGLGGEILNHYGLTAGQVYKVGVRNYNSALGTGTYTICVKMLKRGGCDYGPGPYTLCQYFKATWAGATGTTYTYTFTGLTGPAAGSVYTRIQNSDICLLSNVVPTLPYGSTYSVLITNIYSINNAAGVAENISVPALTPCSMIISNEPTTALRTTDQCAAGPRFRGAIVASLPWVCGATNWRWEFTELDASGNPLGLPIAVNRGSASNYLSLGAVLQLQNGKTYSVRTAPILAYTGTNYQWGAPVCMSIVGTTAMVADGSQANQQVVRTETANDVNMSLYPNPTHGTDVNINLSGIISDNVQMRVVDAMGRQVWNNRYSVNGVLNTNITFERPLANGLYMVEAIFNGEVQTQRMMVQK